MIYRIAKWHEVFETAESRRHKSLRWISFPVGLDSTGYNDLIEVFGDDAPSIYGAWCALLSVAAKAPVRGVLANSRNQPYSMSYIAAQTRVPADALSDLFTWASQETVGWLEVSDDRGLFQDNPTRSDPVAAQANPGLHNKTLHNKTLQDQAASAAGVPLPSGSDTADPAKALGSKVAKKAKQPKPGDPGPSVEHFPVKRSKQFDRELWNLPQRELENYQRIYGDHLNVIRELAKARQWLNSHKDRRKTAGGMLKFLTAWLNRASDSTRSRCGKAESQEVLL